MTKDWPSAATWFLQTFGSSPDNDAILGDLLEKKQQQGRSGFWLWRQVLIAVVTSAWEVVVSNKLLALRCVLMGWTMAIVYSYMFVRYVIPFFHAQFISTAFWLWEKVSPGRHWYPYYDAVTGVFLLALEVLTFAIGLHIGATMARFHRDQKKAFMVLFSMLTSLILLVGFAYLTASHPALPVSRSLIANYIWVFATLVGSGVLRRPSSRIA